MPADTAAPDELPHLAGVADREFIRLLSAATAWWATQRTWQVSSSHTGGGVIAAFESAIVAAVGPQVQALALPSATTALATALEILGVAPGRLVGVPAVDWTATGAVVSALGARTVPLPVNPDTGLLDAYLVARHGEATRNLAALVAVHLHGLSCDVPALRRACPGLPLVEDAAQAWAGSYPDGHPIGSAADACAFSFGAAKSPSAGELGCLVTRSQTLHRAAVARTQHPTRQLLAGVASPLQDQAMTRAAPAAALLGAHALKRHAEMIPALRRGGRLATDALREAGLPVLTDPDQHAPGVVAVRAAPEHVRRVLSGVSFPTTLRVTAVDRADVNVHRGYPEETSLAVRIAGITVITLGSPVEEDGPRPPSATRVTGSPATALA
jgi:dTDP-4-amino-4,6-dideoxygalactose transaminase